MGRPVCDSNSAVRDALEHSQQMTMVRPHHLLEGAVCFFSSLPPAPYLPPHPQLHHPAFLSPLSLQGFLLSNEVCRRAPHTLESSTCPSFRSLLMMLPFLMLPSLIPRTISNPREHVFTVAALYLPG